MDLHDNCTFRIYQETDSIKVHLSTLYYNHISAIVIKYAKYIVFLFQPYHSAVCTNELNWGLQLYLSTVVTADCSPSCPGDGFVCWPPCFRDRLNNCWCKNPAPGCSLLTAPRLILCGFSSTLCAKRTPHSRQPGDAARDHHMSYFSYALHLAEEWILW